MTTTQTPIQDTLRSLAQEDTLTGRTANILRAAIRKYDTANHRAITLADSITKAAADVADHIRQGYSLTSFVGGYADSLADALDARRDAIEKITEMSWLLDIDPTDLFTELVTG